MVNASSNCRRVNIRLSQKSFLFIDFIRQKIKYSYILSIFTIWNALLPLIRQLQDNFWVKFWSFWCEKLFDKFLSSVFITDSFSYQNILNWLKKGNNRLAQIQVKMLGWFEQIKWVPKLFPVLFLLYAALYFPGREQYFSFNPVCMLPMSCKKWGMLVTPNLLLMISS